MSRLGLVGILVSSCFVNANDQTPPPNQFCDEIHNQCVESGQWDFSISIGVGWRTNPLNESDNIPLIILPEFSYYGDRFFIDNLDIGYTVSDTEVSSLNLIATPSFDSVFFNRWDPGNLFVNLASNVSGSLTTPDQVEDNLTEINPSEISKRKFSYLAGLEYSQDFENSLLQVSLLNDISNTHSGKEIRFAYAYSFSHSFSTTLGFTWKDKKLTDYYYGVNPDEIVDDRGAYQASASFNPFVRITLNTESGDKESWRFSLEFQKLNNQITKSPIVNDDYVMTFFMGKRFRFD